jgi:hypothetical protein
MSIAQFLDRCADLHPLDTKNDSTSFVRGEIDQIAYTLPGDEDFSYVTCNTEDGEIDQLAQHLTSTCVDPATAPPTAQVAEHLKQVRDDMQLAAANQGDAP